MDIEGRGRRNENKKKKKKKQKTKKEKKEEEEDTEELIKRVFKLREVILLVIGPPSPPSIATYRRIGEENYKREKRSSRGVGLEGMRMEGGGDGKE